VIASPVSGLYILKNGGKCGIIYDVGQTDKSEFVCGFGKCKFAIYKGRELI